MFNYYNHGSFLEDIFFPHRKDNVKRVVVLSALTGVFSAAVTNYFSKKENRNQTKKSLDKLGEDIQSIKNRFTDKAEDISYDMKNSIRQKSRDSMNKLPNANVKYDSSNSE